MTEDGFIFFTSITERTIKGSLCLSICGNSETGVMEVG